MTNQVAQTILAQLGGNKFIAMTGAYSLSHSADSLSMRLPTKAARGVGGIRITLDGNDTYTMIAFKMKRKTFEVVESFKESGLYWDQLGQAFTEATGLLTSL
jgi:hypothetical protein